MHAVSAPDSSNLLLATAEELVARMTEAAEAADWPTAGELDRSLAQTLRTLNAKLGAAASAERHDAAERLRVVQARHAAVKETLRTLHESIRRELADVAHGRRGVKSYLESAAE